MVFEHFLDIKIINCPLVPWGEVKGRRDGGQQGQAWQCQQQGVLLVPSRDLTEELVCSRSCALNRAVSAVDQIEVAGGDGCTVSALQQGSPSDPVGNIRNAESANYCISGRKTVFLLSACPKTIADVGLLQLPRLCRIPFPWSGGIMRLSAPVFPYFCCHRVAAGDQQRAPCGRDPAAVPGGCRRHSCSRSPDPNPLLPRCSVL